LSGNRKDATVPSNPKSSNAAVKMMRTSVRDICLALNTETSSPDPLSRHLRGALGACRSAAKLLLDIALPTLCIACREPVAGEGVCAACWGKLSFIAPPHCPRLGIPFVYDPGPEMLSMEAIANPPAYSRARAAVRYDDIARTLVHALKYQDRTDLAPTMGRWMARAGHELLEQADMLIPVPLHWRRAWSRRYNQSGALARVIQRQAGIKMKGELLRRVRATEQQIGLNRAQRASNVQGAFQVGAERQSEVQGARVVLIDDVLTSGATADACARALLRAKAAQVDVLVFARVVDTR
jgi:ComF family protein